MDRAMTAFLNTLTALALVIILICEWTLKLVSGTVGLFKGATLMDWLAFGGWLLIFILPTIAMKAASPNFSFGTWLSIAHIFLLCGGVIFVMETNDEESLREHSFKLGMAFSISLLVVLIYPTNLNGGHNNAMIVAVLTTVVTDVIVLNTIKNHLSGLPLFYPFN